MKIFETERLIIRSLEKSDKKYFAELFTDSRVLELIPQKAFTDKQITERFEKSLNINLNDLSKRKCSCGIFIKGKTELIGLALFLINDADEKELGYRFREAYWGNGYGAETTKGMLKYYFEEMKESKVTADVNIANVASVKILNKFMKPVYEFFNERDNCTDRRYELEKRIWLEYHN
ncbi:GNAT family N-acetyltransferase [Pseudotamlana agarivorans]|uniref:GNAT family N-acetyltransferase n=1 Tax=Pseudotamlana agarivorans TaxID=481183 RepID=UPI0008296080|nr:GNAT family N-acetyltransferase [Tamlana agarivorans]